VAIARWRPANDLASLHSTMDRLFSDVFGDSFAGRGGDGDDSSEPTFYLPVDIKETENGYMVQAPIPGVRPEDVEVSFADGVLTINANRREEREQREGRFLRREIAFGNYQRRIALPGDVQAENITARFDNGVLTVEVPRSARPEPRRIEVQPGEQSRQESAGTSGDSSSDGSDQASSDVSSQGSGAAKSEGSDDTSGQAAETSGKEAETSTSSR
jgi:HSP20 family protein